MENVLIEVADRVAVVTINRPAVRNAVDPATARELSEHFRAIDTDPGVDVAVLTGAGTSFCSGADLGAVARGESFRIEEDGDGPLGVTRMLTSKPVLAAIEGHAVAGGLELALWCDLRVAAENAVFAVSNRRFDVPLIDMGTLRLPRIVGQARALEMILTGRSVGATEALTWGLATKVVPDGAALRATLDLAGEIASFPQTSLRSDRMGVYESWARAADEAVVGEVRRGIEALRSGDAIAGARRFISGEGRSGEPLT